MCMCVCMCVRWGSKQSMSIESEMAGNPHQQTLEILVETVETVGIVDIIVI